MTCSATTIGRMKTPIARSSVVSSRYRYESVSSQTNVETAREGFANGTCRTSIVCIPMTKVWTSAPNRSSVVAARPTRAPAARNEWRRRPPRPRTGAAGARSTRRRGVVAPFGARRHVRPSIWTTMRRHAPSRLAVLRGVAERVLAGELVGDLGVHAVEVVDFRREERAPAGFLRELSASRTRPRGSPCLCVSAPRSAIVKMAVSLRLASSRTSSNEIRLDVSSPSENRTSAWRRTSSSPTARSSPAPSARCRSRCAATSSRRPPFAGWPPQLGLVAVNPCRISTRLSKSITCARSFGLQPASRSSSPLSAASAACLPCWRCCRGAATARSPAASA